ncbi:MAG TPA: hypothetical protein VM802_05765 [Chitinophaga sp.]|uniref:hypothetical protein n=1 Tax=Chitinophaga sp. TaxID=1869181 RepID=UPI002C4EF2CE|nr:hypothetical protein [Chitinophaga sp.]HVI44352.1 hypothetical protein [Chitinophaga sp.]
MEVEDSKTGGRYEIMIERLTLNDFKIVKKDKIRFDSFNWSKYREQEVYKLRLTECQEILGLMCLNEFPPETGINALEIELLEVSVENRGNNKRLQGIAGCLIAFACREAFNRGYKGWVFLIPKSELIEHYSKAYGFVHIPLRAVARPEGFMELETGRSVQLLKKYGLI